MRQAVPISFLERFKEWAGGPTRRGHAASLQFAAQAVDGTLDLARWVVETPGECS